MTPQPQHNRTLKWEPHWITPPELYKKLDDEFHFNYDPCPFPKPKDYNGIEANWGTSNYVNPPFHPENGIGPTAFVRKAIEENKKGKTVVLTIPTQSYVNLLLEAGAELRSLGRVKWLHTVTREPMKGPSPITAFILRSSPNRLQHCDHECVCPDYFDGGGFPCDGILIPEIGKREKCPHDTRTSRPTPRLNTQPKGTTCEDCQRFRTKECPYPESNITITKCNSFMIDLESHDATIAAQAREDYLNEIKIMANGRKTVKISDVEDLHATYLKSLRSTGGEPR